MRRILVAVRSIALRLDPGLSVLAVPIGVGALLLVALWYADMTWARDLARAAWIEGEAVRGPRRLAEVCADPALGTGIDSCALRQSAWWLLLLAVLTALAVIGVLVAIVFARRRCTGDRVRLLATFRPALSWTMHAACGLMVANAALLGGALYVLTKGFTAGLVIAFAIAAVLGIVGVRFALARMFEPEVTDVIGVEVSREQAPALRDLVRRVARSLGTSSPTHIVVGLTPRCFAGEGVVRCISGELTGRTMYLSLPLCRQLSIEELTSIIGHELAHFAGADTLFAMRFSPIYRGAIHSARALDEQTSDIARLVLRPAFALCRFFLTQFTLVEAAIRRDEELKADQQAAQVSSPLAAATALIKAYTLQGSRLETLLAREVPRPTDEHPPLGVRLAALGVSVDQVQNAAPAESAMSLFADIEAIERVLPQPAAAPQRREASPRRSARPMFPRVAVAFMALLAIGAMWTGTDSTRAILPAWAWARAAAVPPAAPMPSFTLSRPLPDAVELMGLLRDQRFDDLEHRLADYVRGSRDDIESEWISDAAFETFAVDDRSVTSLLDEWIARRPASTLAHAARARHLTRSGYLARGDDGKRAMHATAQADAEQAVAGEPDFVEPYVDLIDLARARGDDRACETLTSRALRIAPVSARVREACVMCLLPRWSSSTYHRAQALAIVAQHAADRNPRLRALQGFVDWDDGRGERSVGHDDLAIELFSRALSRGENWRFYVFRGDAHYRQHRYALALTDYEQAVRLRPYAADLVAARARALARQ